MQMALGKTLLKRLQQVESQVQPDKDPLIIFLSVLTPKREVRTTNAQPSPDDFNSEKQRALIAGTPAKGKRPAIPGCTLIREDGESEEAFIDRVNAKARSMGVLVVEVEDPTDDH
jgi:hypothetical protein